MRLAYPTDNFHQGTPTATEHKLMPGIRIFGQHLLRLRCQCVEAPPHIRHARRKPRPRVARRRGYAVRPCTNPTTEASEVGPSIRIRRPSDSVMPIRCEDSRPTVSRHIVHSRWSGGAFHRRWLNLDERKYLQKQHVPLVNIRPVPAQTGDA